MLLSAVSVLVVAQSSSEIPEGLMNNPVCVWNAGRYIRGTLEMHESQLRLRHLNEWCQLAESAFRKPRNKHNAYKNVGVYLSESVVSECRRRDVAIIFK